MNMIQKAHSLQQLHTFNLNAKTAYYGTFESTDALISLINNTIVPPHLPKMVLGGGSNVIFLEDYPGLILHNHIQGIKVMDTAADHVMVRVGSGEVWHNLVLHAIAQGWHGIENLALIPGSVGAAPVQNIGAYGVEVHSFIENIHFYNWEEKKTQIINHQEAAFGYRDSLFKNELKGKGVITHVDFKFALNPHFNLSYKPLKEYFSDYNPEDITAKEIANAVIQIRQSKLPDPKEIPNAGSFFKNPIIDSVHFESLLAIDSELPHYPSPQGMKIPAAYFIQQTGWKGKPWNTVGVHKNQSLVLINLGNGTAQDLKSLINAIQQDVYKKYNIHLEPEVQLIQNA